ncbi:hypothetical protein RQP46_004571 [Phenoliferia psychrophenolica]
MSTDVTPQEASRISSHMNNEHGESLGWYLELYGKVKNAVDPKITAFTTPSMTIEHGKAGQRKSWVYKFDPPMQAGQARKRLEEMHQDARKALGISNVRVNEFKLATSTWVILAVTTAVEVGVLACPPAVFAHWTPWGVKQVAKVLPYFDAAPTQTNLGNGLKAALTLFWVVAHLFEIQATLLPLFRKYSTTSSSTRTAYMIATFFGGFPVWSAMKAGAEAEERAIAEKDKTH